MHDPSHYRQQAQRARRLARAQTNREIEALLSQMAREYDDIALDIEPDAIEVRHSELMPQTRR
jgi:hypothetical protein